jgi:hypothetical protein
MIRTQIQLTETQMRALRRLARGTGRSLAAVIRARLDECLQNALGPTREERLKRARALFRRFRSGKRDLSSRHDRHLADAFSK